MIDLRAHLEKLADDAAYRHLTASQTNLRGSPGRAVLDAIDIDGLLAVVEAADEMRDWIEGYAYITSEGSIAREALNELHALFVKAGQSWKRKVGL